MTTPTPIKKVGRPKGKFVTYEEAREWVSRLKLSSYREWLKFSKKRIQRGKDRGLRYKPRVIPANPQTFYKDEWISDAHFLGHVSYLSYEEAHKLALSKTFKNVAEWLSWHRETKTEYVPQQPDVYYKEWKSWGEFLGTGNISTAQRNKMFRPYPEAKKYIQSQNLLTENDYKEWRVSNNIIDFPAVPEVTYVDDWEGWPKFLGKTISDKVEGHNLDVSVLAIIQNPTDPGNVYGIKVYKDGKSSVLAKQRTELFRIIKVYKNEIGQQQTIHQIISRNSSPWWDGDNTFIVQNIHQLLFDLDSILLWA